MYAKIERRQPYDVDLPVAKWVAEDWRQDGKLAHIDPNSAGQR